VEFDDLTHSYLLDREIYLMGVTTLMKKHKLSADYSNIPEEILMRAAERGSKGHKWIEEYCKKGKRGNATIIKEFKKLNLKVLENEFLVSDNEIVASMIDIILEDYSIVDIKFTAQLHIKALQWQLSIYAYLLELYYGIKVPALYALHFNKQNKASLVEIERLPDGQVSELFRAEKEGRIYEPLPAPATTTDKAIMELYNLTTYIDNLKRQIKDAEEQQKVLHKAFLQKMEETRTKSIATDFCRITYIGASERESVDTKLLKDEMPEVFEQYKKIINIKPSVRITITKDDK
jgi:hypothetical protein